LARTQSAAQLVEQREVRCCVAVQAGKHQGLEFDFGGRHAYVSQLVPVARLVWSRGADPLGTVRRRPVLLATFRQSKLIQDSPPKQKDGRSRCRPPISRETMTHFELVIAVRSAESLTMPAAPHKQYLLIVLIPILFGGYIYEKYTKIQQIGYRFLRSDPMIIICRGRAKMPAPGG
jgi:hypothetical protein